MIIIGIDPGKEGAYCKIDTETSTIKVVPLLWSLDGMLLSNFGVPDFVVVEKLGGIPGYMSKKSIWTMARYYGHLEERLRDFRTLYVNPKDWQSWALEGTNVDLDTKLRSQQAFIRANPEARKCKLLNHNFTDAYHIACYGAVKRANVNTANLRWTEENPWYIAK